MGVGRINTGEMANQVIADGKFDLVGIGRAQVSRIRIGLLKLEKVKKI